jgi:hypothetical protein
MFRISLDWVLFGIASAHAPAWLAGAAAVGLVTVGGLWAWIERRSRGSWHGVAARTVSVGAGPYRTAIVPLGRDRAPIGVRVVSLFGFVAGAGGVVWLAALVADLSELGHGASVALAIEGAGVTISAWLLVRARDLVRSPSRAPRPRALDLVAALGCAAIAVSYLGGAFDALDVDAGGIKWRETMALGDFLRAGFFTGAGRHSAPTWRLLLDGVAASAIASSIYAAFALIALRGSAPTPSPRS